MKPARLAAAMAALLVPAAPAAAITSNGTYDGNGHPNVAALITDWSADDEYRPLCTGTLVDADTVVSASHCTAFLEGLGWDVEMFVTFDPDLNDGYERIPATWVTNPDFVDGRADSPGDLAVVELLGAAPRGTRPAALPRSGQLREMRDKGKLTTRTKFTAVGYGSQEAQNAPGGQQFPADNRRNVAYSTFRSLEPHWLNLSQNQSVGDGGTCYGDSGGPNFLGGPNHSTYPGLLAAITVTGDAACKNSNKTYRLDTKAARRFLRGYVTLP